MTPGKEQLHCFVRPQMRTARSFLFHFFYFKLGIESAFLSLGHDPLCEGNTYHGQVCRCCPSFLPAVLMSTKASMSPVSPPFRLQLLAKGALRLLTTYDNQSHPIRPSTKLLYHLNRPLSRPPMTSKLFS